MKANINTRQKFELSQLGFIYFEYFVHSTLKDIVSHNFLLSNDIPVFSRILIDLVEQSKASHHMFKKKKNSDIYPPFSGLESLYIVV